MLMSRPAEAFDDLPAAEDLTVDPPHLDPVPPTPLGSSVFSSHERH